MPSISQGYVSLSGFCQPHWHRAPDSSKVSSPNNNHNPSTKHKRELMMLISLTVGKVDAGVAVLLTQDKRLVRSNYAVAAFQLDRHSPVLTATLQIEFPSILLPPNISSGSIVDITVSRNFDSETLQASRFHSLQDSILQSFGVHEPSAPVLRCRNATQTSIVLEWDPIQLATAEILSLSLWRNGQKAGNIPKPMEQMSTKISGLAVDTDYNFQLVLRTTAGTFASEKLEVRTHKMTDLSGITVTPGILPAQLKESLQKAVERIGAKMADTVRIDTTHFVTTEGRGMGWEKAVEMNIPVVRPEWVEGCERGGRIVGVRQYYLDADPRQRMNMGSISQQGGQHAQHEARKPSVSSSQSKKEEEPLPALPTDEPSPTVNGQAVKKTEEEANKKSEDQEKKDEDKSEDEKHEEAKQKTELPQEQKVKIEDRDQQKMAMRPKSPETDEDNEADVPKSPVARVSQDGTTTPGAASFQDVAL